MDVKQVTFSKRRHNEQRQKGFTLIELLVVIAIISILASILFPVFARARENARRASCASNMKQLALSCLMYAQDYDNKLPCTNTLDIIWSGGAGWGALDPYIKNPQVLLCPSAPAPSAASNKQNYGIASGFGVSLNNSLTISSQFIPYPLDAIPYPSLTCMIGETGRSSVAAITSTNNPAGCASGWHFDPTAQGGNAVFDAMNRCDSMANLHQTRHFDGANYAYLDGHVKWIKSDVVDAVYTAETTAGTGITTASAGNYPIVFAWKK